MQEKARLLMEETGCEQGEAELALELAGQDLEKAIHTIEGLLRHIFAVKGKFYLPEKNNYGLLLLIINTKTESILRLRAVVSYNPALYENSPEMDWYALEKLIFSNRLDGGSLQDFTQDIEQRLHEYLSRQKDQLVKPDAIVFGDMLSNFFAPEKVISFIKIEELNLAQFKRLPDGQEIASIRQNTSELEHGVVVLDVALIEDSGGKTAGRLSEGDVVMTLITDTRDIAHYLAHLIGSRKDDDNTPLPAIIKKITINKSEYTLQVLYSPGIMGIANVANDFKAKVSEERNQPWWKKLMLWS